MTENRPDFSETLSPAVAAQVTEALENGPGDDANPKPRTKSVTWRNRIWQVRQKPGAVFLDRYESGKVMKAAEAVLGEKQYADMLDLDPDLDGAEGMDGFFTACNKVWGLGEGN